MTQPELTSSDVVVDVEFTRLLDLVYEKLESKTFDSLNTLYLGLFGYRRSMPTDTWREYCRVARRHKLNELVLRSPLTRRAFEKPRGYAGDAVMIDMLYGYGEPPRNLTPLGEEIYRFERQTPASKSVRARRDHLGNIIDFVASSVRGARVLSIACGHLREALASETVKSGSVGEIIALDQDPESLAVLRDYQFKNIKAVHGSVRGLLKGSVEFHDLDLVYAAGLYDYLPDSVATSMTSRMFGMLRPSGRCLIANFAPDLFDIGYMDAFMDWHLIYRDEQQIAALTAGIPPEQVLTNRVFRDPIGNITYCEVVKA